MFIAPSQATTTTTTTTSGKEKQQQQQPASPLVASLGAGPSVEDFKENFFSSHGKKLHRLQARHIVSVKQFSYEDLRYLFSVAHDMRVMVKCMGCLDLLKVNFLLLSLGEGILKLVIFL